MQRVEEFVGCSSYIQDVWNVGAVGEPLGLTPGPRGTPFGAVAADASAASLS